MSEANRAEYWIAKAEAARKLAIGMRDPMSRRGMFQLAASYDGCAETGGSADAELTTGCLQVGARTRRLPVTS